MLFNRRNILKTSSLGAIYSVIPSFLTAQVELGRSTIRTVSDGEMSLPASLTFDTMPQDKLGPLLQTFNLSKNNLVRECNITLLETKSHKVLF